MRNDFELLELNVCPECFSSYLEEVYIAGTNSYHIECKHCGNTSEPTLIQEEAKILWNSVKNDDVEFFKAEIIACEVEIRRCEREIEDLEEEIDGNRWHINNFKKELSELMGGGKGEYDGK